MLDSGLQDQGADGLPRHLHEDTRGAGPREFRDHLNPRTGFQRQWLPDSSADGTNFHDWWCRLQPAWMIGTKTNCNAPTPSFWP